MATFPSIMSIDPSTLKFMQERERFTWFARGMAGRVGDFDINAIKDSLYGAQNWPAQREKALVALALLGTEEAGDIIADFDPGDDGHLEVFHAICADEWSRRPA